MKVAEIGVGSGELTLKNGPNDERLLGSFPSWVQLTLSSKRSTKVSGGPAVGQRWRVKKTLARRIVRIALSPHEHIRRAQAKGGATRPSGAAGSVGLAR